MYFHAVSTKVSEIIENEVLQYLQERVERNTLRINKDFFFPSPKVNLLTEIPNASVREKIDFDANHPK